MPNTESHNTPENNQDIFSPLSSQAKVLTQLNNFIIRSNDIDVLKQAEKELVEKITTYEFSWDENMNAMSDLLNRLHGKIQDLESQTSQENNNNNNPLVQKRQQQGNNSRIIRNQTKISQQKYTQQSKIPYHHNSSSNNNQNIPTMLGVVSTPPQINNKPQHVNQMMGIKTIAPSNQANNNVEALNQLTNSNNDDIDALRQRKSVLQQRLNGANISLKEYWNTEEELRKIKQKLNAIDNKPMPNNNNNNFNNIPIDIELDQIQNDDDKLDNSVSNSYKNINLPELVKSYDKSLLKILKHGKDSKQGKEEIRQFKSTYPDIHAYLYGQAIYGGDRPQLLLKAEEHSVALRFIQFLRAKPTDKEIREVIAKNDNQVIKILQSQNIKTQAQAIYSAFQNISPQPFNYFLSFFNDKAVLESSIVEINNKSRDGVAESKRSKMKRINAKLQQLQPQSQKPISTVGKRTRLQAEDTVTSANTREQTVSKKQKLNTGEHKYRFFSYQPTVNAATKIKNLIANSDDLNILQQTKQMINARLSTASITLDEYEETKEQLSLVNNRIDQLTSMDNQTKSI